MLQLNAKLISAGLSASLNFLYNVTELRHNDGWLMTDDDGCINLVGFISRSPCTVMDVQVATDEFLAGVGFSGWISESRRSSSYVRSTSITTTFSLTPTLYKIITTERKPVIKRSLFFYKLWNLFLKANAYTWTLMIIFIRHRQTYILVHVQ